MSETLQADLALLIVVCFIVWAIIMIVKMLG